MFTDCDTKITVSAIAEKLQAVAQETKTGTTVFIFSSFLRKTEF